MTFVVQEYAGIARSPSTVGVIRLDGREAEDVTAVDGEPLGIALERGNRIHVEVLPGVHDVELQVREAGTGLVRRISVRFVAEAGRVYRVERSSAADAYGGFRAYEVDPRSDLALRAARQADPG